MININSIVYSLSVLLMISQVYAYTPMSTTLNNTQTNMGLRSNGVIDITLISDSSIAVGTGDGIGIGVFRNGELFFSNLSSTNLPLGGFPSVISKNNIIAVSGVSDTIALGESMPKGTGIGYSMDLGSSWHYFKQPIDSLPNVFSCPYSDNLNNYYQESDSLICESECIYPFSCNQPQKKCIRIYDWIDWGSQDSIRHLSTTVDIWNVTYDMSLADDYLYTASFTGGLRRLKISDEEDAAYGDWEVIPLPMDSQKNLLCDQIDTNSYEYDVNDSCPSDNNPCDEYNPNKCNPYLSGEMNHKVYSVYTQEDTIWVGTANGINKGTIVGDCIDWKHINSNNSDISGNWVVGFTVQSTDFGDIVYAITWPTDDGEFSSVSYSFNGGVSWSPVEQFKEYGVKVFELDSDDYRVYAATDNGLFVSENYGQYWERYSRPSDSSGEQILSEKVYSVLSIDNANKLIIGSDDGVAVTSDDGLTWDVYRFWSKSAETVSFNPYPNPFYRKYSNVVRDNGNVRFIINDANGVLPNAVVGIDVYDFSMDRVANIINPIILDDGVEFIWDGLNNYRMPVPNGTYFCRLEYNNSYYWTKLVVIN